MDAVSLSEAIGAKRVSCREVMAAFLDQIERFNPQVNAIVSLQPRGTLLQQAEERDRELARGQRRGWMHGFPHAVKDLAPTRGLRTTWGSPLLDAVPGEDAIFVDRMRNNGAIIIGKTNVPEFGMGSQTYNPIFGTTLNPYDLSKTAGGSSGGAAATLALRMLPVADGSDMMGSLRNPAAYNNVLALRPSYGRVPSAEIELFFGQLMVAGPMARSVADLAMLLSVMARPDPRMPLSIDEDPAIFTRNLERDFHGTHVAWLGDLGGYLLMEPGIMDLCGAALKTLQTIGCTVEETGLGFPPEQMWDAWITLRQWLIAGNLGALYKDPAKRARMKPEAAWEVENGLKLSAEDVYQASVARSELYRAVLRVFETYEYLALPSAQVFPFDADIHWPKAVNGVAMDTYHRWMEVVVLASMLGFPVVNVPVGFSRDHLPMGMQIIGKHHADFSVLQLAHAYEQTKKWVRDRLPTLLSCAWRVPFMRVAIVSDIHGNLTALEAVIADFKVTSPDLVLQGGDLVVGGPRPAEVIDRIRELDWAGVLGNTDEVLWAPEQFDQQVKRAPKLRELLEILFHDFAAMRELLGNERVQWLRALPPVWQNHGITLLHAGPGDLWQAPMPDCEEQQLIATYGGLGSAIVVYGHIHRPYVRQVPGFVVANSGSVGMPYDGDPRASYLLIEDGSVTIRRVAYDVEAEIKYLLSSGYPRGAWLAEVRRHGKYVPPF